jgi:hypothetical protein
MNPLTRLGLYTLGLAVAFTGALGTGRLTGPLGAPAAHQASTGHSEETGHGDTGKTARATAAAPGGLQVADGGYRLIPLTPTLAAGTPTEFTFQILGPDGAPVTAYAPTHDRDLHLIVVRRDLSGFQHLHPTRGGAGTWRIPLTAREPGQYRVFADFQPASRDTPLTLGIDVPAAGIYEPQPLPAPARVADVDGYRVELTGDLTPGSASKLTLRVTRDGRPVTDLQPYLDAYGHLVALRDGDLAYLHVHPGGAPGDGRTAAGPEVTFYAEVPSAGAYRLYLDFQHNGTVRTAEFTAVAGVAATTAGTPSPAAPGPAVSGPAAPSASGHNDQHGHG